jgi:hypothetical protein
MHSGEAAGVKARPYKRAALPVVAGDHELVPIANDLLNRIVMALRFNQKSPV